MCFLGFPCVNPKRSSKSNPAYETLTHKRGFLWSLLFLGLRRLSFSWWSNIYFLLLYSHNTSFISDFQQTWWEKRAKFGHKWHHCQYTREWKINSWEENVRSEAVRRTSEVWPNTITDLSPHRGPGCGIFKLVVVQQAHSSEAHPSLISVEGQCDASVFRCCYRVGMNVKTKSVKDQPPKKKTHAPIYMWKPTRWRIFSPLWPSETAELQDVSRLTDYYVKNRNVYCTKNSSRLFFKVEI